jgi:hypothetical protein
MSSQRFARDFFANNFEKFILRYESGDFDIVRHWIEDGDLRNERKKDPFILQYSDQEIVKILSKVYHEGLAEIFSAKSKTLIELQEQLAHYYERKFYIDSQYKPESAYESERYRIENICSISRRITDIYKARDFEKNLISCSFTLNGDDIEVVRSPKEKERLYTYERKLRGGYVRDFRGGILLSHGAVRHKDFRHGDKLRFTHETPHRDGVTFHFDVAERVDLPQPDRIEINIAKLKSDGNKLYIDSYYCPKTGDMPSITVEDTQQRFYFSDKDIKDYMLEADMFIDAAYWKDNPETIKVLWRHTVEPTQSSPKLPSFYKQGKDKDDDNDNLPLSSIECAILRGKKIAIVGCDPREAILKETLKRIGSDFVAISGDGEPKATVMSRLRNVDAVVANYKYSNHIFIKQMNAYCKEIDMPIRNISTFGISSMLRAAISAMTGTRVGEVI